MKKKKSKMIKINKDKLDTFKYKQEKLKDSGH